ncbi:MAG: hypothetical protein IJU23_03480 [Proteobacteria bacterium]|nr:hypothetical protein [Pseudomonadota bacterium]
MKKKWLFLLGLSVSLGYGCASDSGDDAGTHECKDGANGESYWCKNTDVCCAGSCVTQTEANCGACGNQCSPGSVCQDGTCICQYTNSFCSETCTPDGCVDVKTNPKHCGSIGNACKTSAGEVCDNGECTTSCSGDLDNCDGRCVDLDNNVESCGACNVKCPTATDSNHIQRSYCLGGECNIICVAGYTDEDENIANGCEQKASFTCGNGIVEPGEMCDGLRLNDQTCATIVGPGSTGTLTCRPDCLGFDKDNCSAPTTCGNHIIDGSEICDGPNTGLATCASVVGEGSTGYIGCQSNCQDYDTSYCSKPTTCGNNTIDAGEVCDGSSLNNASCASVVGVGSTGTLKCSENCYDYDRTGCTSASVCGNGILETGENCDGNDFGSQTCESLVGPGSRGNLLCNGCSISTENCSAASTCGNGIIDGTDVCDGSAINGATCASIVGEGSKGSVTCRDNCSGYDISGCTAAAKCGNGLIEEGEVCDGNRLNDRTCATEVGFNSTGTLACNSTCTGYITTGCSASTTCGNGILEAGEMCDTTNIQGATCESSVGMGSVGTVLCGADCKSLNLSGCSAATKCGNGVLDEGELCDGKNISGATCASVVGEGSTGTISCGDGCKHFDVSKCSKPKSCGDGNINDNEVCDGTTLGGRTCADVVGFGSKGVLKCSPNCMGFDTSMCTPEVKCGNGKLDAGEVCDGAFLNGATCSAQVGFGSTGTLTCNSTCSGYITTGCSEAKKCGNGKLDDGEICDGALLNGRTCVQQVGFGSTGTPACNETCSGYTTGSCTPEIKCGNGILDSGEKCDTTLLNGATCESVVGMGSTGTLSCNNKCEFDTAKCTASVGCGNGKIDEGEACETDSSGKVIFANTSMTKCQQYAASVFKSGNLGCTPTCQIDTSACVPYCGDNVRNTTVNGVYIGETCDTFKFPTTQNTCAKIIGAGSTGELSCSEDCSTIITSGCTAAATCGDGILNGDNEWCDGNDFMMGSADCSLYSPTYKSGTNVHCLSNCEIDPSPCQLKEFCGDGIVNGSEDCDRDSFLFGHKACSDWDSKYSSGNVKCNNTSCTIDYSECVLKPTTKCGNGKLDAGEFCDGTNFDPAISSCEAWSSTFEGGTLKCTSDCQIDDSSCTVKAVCGDNKIDAGEECDGTTFVNKYCKNYDANRFKSGQLKCSSCKIDTSDCVTYCGDGTVSGTTLGEKCDHNATTGVDKFPTSANTCAKVVGTGSTGTLACSDDCSTIITTGCSAPVVETCGDGIVNQTSEQCDGSAFRNNKKACNYWNSAYTSGDMKCKTDCTFDESDCVTEVPASCGDGIVNQASEKCDGKAIKSGLSWNCADYDSTLYASGTLGCSSSCDFTTDKCVLKPVTKCGNNKLDEDDDEECDVVSGTTKFYGDVSSCADYSSLYTGGNLKCTTACKVDTSSCVVKGCGDGVLSADEECDGTQYQPEWNTCAKVSSTYSGGTLNCVNCEIDDSGCTRKCGNGTVDSNEECDGTHFAPDMDTCDDWITGSTGTLKCTSTCEVDYSSCKAKPTAYCGDGIVNTSAESCDGSAFIQGNNKCADYSSRYESGTLTCNSDCSVNTSGCKEKYVAACGNGVFDDATEECDAGQFLYGIKTCAEYSASFNSGMLKCTNCEIDTSGCSYVEVNKCGNGKLDEDEFCDGKYFLGNEDNCTDWGDFASGKVKCNATCDIDTSACIKKPDATCGDGIVNQANEDCDGSAYLLDITDCSDYSSAFSGGKLKCKSNCTIDTSSCTKKPSCGDGKLDEGEECDGSQFHLNIKTCAEFSEAYAGSTANLSCNSNCTINETECKRICTENQIICGGVGDNEVLMCVDGNWQQFEDCNASGKTCQASEDDGSCVAAPIAFDYCAFNYLDTALYKGYGRLLLPSGKTVNDVLGFLACTTDLNKPVVNWATADAVHNTSCGDCYSNQEFMTTEAFKTTAAGTYYCTFIFSFGDDIDYACRPVDTNAGAAQPIPLTKTTKLTADLTRSFYKDGCAENQVRCTGSVLEMCVDGVWDVVEECTGSKPVCSVEQEDCIAAGFSYDNLVTMTGWKKGSGAYTMSTDSEVFADGSSATVVARITTGSDTDVKPIDGVSAVMSSSKGSNVTIKNLTSGVGLVSFKYKTYKTTDGAIVTVSDGSTSQTLTITGTDNTVQTASFTFSNSTATQVTVTSTATSSNGRYVIDDIRWTSAL